MARSRRPSRWPREFSAAVQSSTNQTWQHATYLSRDAVQTTGASSIDGSGLQRYASSAFRILIGGLRDSESGEWGLSGQRSDRTVRTIHIHASDLRPPISNLKITRRAILNLPAFSAPLAERLRPFFPSSPLSSPAAEYYPDYAAALGG
jgi:hypothetical protein